MLGRQCRQSSRCSEDGGTEHHGKYFTYLYAVGLCPKPLQKPHPPVWMACSPAAHHRARGSLRPGRAGFPVRQRRCCARLGACLLQRHHQTARSSLITRSIPISRSSASSCAARPTRRRASVPTARRSSIRSTLVPGLRATASAPRQVRSTCGMSTTSGSAPIRTRRKRHYGAASSVRPDTLRKKLRQFETFHIDQVIMLNQAGKNRHEDICKSLELLPREVMPEFQGRHAAHEVWKAAVMNREINLEEIEHGCVHGSLPGRQCPPKCKRAERRSQPGASSLNPSPSCPRRALHPCRRLTLERRFGCVHPANMNIGRPR